MYIDMNPSWSLPMGLQCFLFLFSKNIFTGWNIVAGCAFDKSIIKLIRGVSYHKLFVCSREKLRPLSPINENDDGYSVDENNLIKVDLWYILVYTKSTTVVYTYKCFYTCLYIMMDQFWNTSWRRIGQQTSCEILLYIMMMTDIYMHAKYIKDIVCVYITS